MGGDLSARRGKTKKPLLIFGQDESTFHQYCFSKNYWKSPDGKSFIQPKGTGEIVMLSGF